MCEMHERHVKLMRDMEDHYRNVQTENYYINYLNEWKDAAREKVSIYRKAIQDLVQEMSEMQQQTEKKVENLQDDKDKLLSEKELLLNICQEDQKANEDKLQEEVKRIEIQWQSKLDMANEEAKKMSEMIDQMMQESMLESKERIAREKEYQQEIRMLEREKN